MADIMKLFQTWQKKTNSEDDKEVDRISQLPDNILHCILSLLPPRYATRTIVLSRQWQRLWEKLSREQQNFPVQQPTTLLTKQCRMYYHAPSGSVDSSLALINGSLDVINDAKILNSLQRLVLVDVFLPEENSLEETISECPRIEELGLWFVDGLKLGGCHWRPGLPTLPYKALTKLSLQIPSITDDWLQAQVLTKLPFLRELQLTRCYMLETLNISSPMLKCLKLNKCRRLKQIKLETPSLEWFLYSDRNVISFSSTRFTADCQFSQTYAHIHAYKEDHREALKLLQLTADLANFSHGNDFELSVDCDGMEELLTLRVEIEKTHRQECLRIPEEWKNLLLPHARVTSLALDVTVKLSSFRDFITPKCSWFSRFSGCFHMNSNKEYQFIEYLRDEMRRRELYRSWPFL